MAALFSIVPNINNNNNNNNNNDNNRALHKCIESRNLNPVDRRRRRCCCPAKRKTSPSSDACAWHYSIIILHILYISICHRHVVPLLTYHPRRIRVKCPRNKILLCERVSRECVFSPIDTAAHVGTWRHATGADRPNLSGAEDRVRFISHRSSVVIVLCSAFNFRNQIILCECNSTCVHSCCFMFCYNVMLTALLLIIKYRVDRESSAAL